MADYSKQSFGMFYPCHENQKARADPHQFEMKQTSKPDKEMRA
jgi:hypothetical protein